jgi:histidinol phosphatase-like enzyme (inositol monophosphatase family)
VSAHEIAARLDHARRIAREAGEGTLRYFQTSDLGTEHKGDGSPVTRADREAELFLREACRSAFPDDAFIGEEFGELPGASGWTWIVDPIDGTQSFVSGVPLFGTMIACVWQGRARAGVVYLPGLGECVSAGEGLGCLWERTGREPVPARVRACERLSDAMFLTTSPEYFHQTGTRPVFDRLERAAGRTRGWSDCYAYVLLATGRADAIAEPLMKVWDKAALQVIVEEAGGVFTNWSGERTLEGAGAIACSPALLAETLRVISHGA